MSRFFIYRPIFAMVISIVIVIAGAVALTTLPISKFPEITPPTVQVTAFYPGANAQVVAETIAAPDIGEAEAGELIADHAAAATDSTRSRQLALLFAGVFQEANLYRRFILEGIVAMMGRRRLAADALAQSQLELEDLAGDPAPEAKTTREAMEQTAVIHRKPVELTMDALTVP